MARRNGPTFPCEKGRSSAPNCWPAGCAASIPHCCRAHPVASTGPSFQAAFDPTAFVASTGLSVIPTLPTIVGPFWLCGTSEASTVTAPVPRCHCLDLARRHTTTRLRRGYSGTRGGPAARQSQRSRVGGRHEERRALPRRGLDRAADDLCPRAVAVGAAAQPRAHRVQHLRGAGRLLRAPAGEGWEGT
jgi:hypothetical protein